MTIRNLIAAFLAPLCLAALPGTAQAIEFTEVARFDVSFAFNADLDDNDEFDNAKYIGTNPLGVAWNGSKLYLAGFDNNGLFRQDGGVSLIEVLNPTRSGENVLGDSDFSPAFGTLFPPAIRGYTGIAIQNGLLAAAYDPGSSTDFTAPSSIQVFDTATNTQLWEIGDFGVATRGGSGVAFDPGFGGDPSQGGGVAWTTFGSGRRALNDPQTGAVVYDLDGSVALGMRWLTDGPFDDNFARDMTVDPDTGDIYVRRSNDIDFAQRDGANATSGRTTLVDGAAGPFVLGHKIEFLSDTEEGDLLIYNDRPATNPPTAFVDAVKVIDKSGAPVAATFNLLGGLTGADIADGVAIYDFDYDEASGTLALLDFANRNVFIFQVGGGVSPLVGDYNGDGSVNAADYTVWRDTRGSTTDLRADGSNNNVIDNADYDLWVANYGAGQPAAATPEPTAAWLASLAAAGLAATRRRGRSRR